MSGSPEIICERRRYTSLQQKHAHHFFQLLLPHQGSLYIETKEQHIELNNKHLLLIPPHCEHLFFSLDRNEFLVLDIPKAFFSLEFG